LISSKAKPAVLYSSRKELLRSDLFCGLMKVHPEEARLTLNRFVV
jgi:hypothetical protein